MSLSKVRKYDSAASSEKQSQAQYGPATAGVQYDVQKKALSVNADGTHRTLGMVWVEDTVPDADDHHAAGTLWVRATGPTLYINVGTAASPDWNVITQS